jgi:hypothetical protein
MRIPIYWTAYRFADEPLSEEGFLYAHLYPHQVRRTYLLSLLEECPLPALRAIGLFLLLFIANGYLRDGASHDSGLTETGLILAGCYVALSLTLSTLSFAGYAISVTSFWERQLWEARHHNDFDTFRRALKYGRAPARESWAPVIGIGLLCVAGFAAFVTFMFASTPSASHSPTRAAAQEPHKPAAPGRMSLDSLICLDVPAADGDCSTSGLMAPSLTPDEARRRQLPGARAFHLFEPATMVANSEPPGQQLQHGIDDATHEAQDLLTDYRLPASLTIDLLSCDGGASYRSGTNHIVVCRSFVRRLYRDARRGHSLGEALNDARDGLRFVIGHEVGHALIDTYRLPVLGREEDAADQFAAFQFLEHGRPLPLMSMINHYYLQEREQGVSAEDFGDVHSVGPQRLANLNCWLYGSDTGRFSSFGDDLPRARREGCHAEYARLSASWSALLGEHLSH